MSSDTRQQLIQLCREVLGPMLAVDGGVLYIISVDQESIAIHLGGTCAGCPGLSATSSGIIEPAIRKLNPAVRLTITSGAAVPSGAIPIADHP